MVTEELNKLFELAKSIDKKSADLQTKTCATLINILEESPGVILGDDVGMGKTYVAFATAVYYLSIFPKKAVIIVTPNWLLNSKWYEDIRNFIEVNLNKNSSLIGINQVAKIEEGYSSYPSYISEIVDKSKRAKVLLIPMNVFASKGWKYEKTFFLSCWFKHKRFWGRTREKVLDALIGDTSLKDPSEFSDMGISYQDIDESWYQNLDKVDVSWGKISQEKVDYIREKVEELRQKVINSIIPNASLLVLDEAHKMKNENTVKRQSLESALYKHFDKAIFLTATPFQLSEGELKSIMRLFEAGRVSKEEITRFKDKVKSLFIEMQKYIGQTNEFEQYVKNLSITDNYILEQLISGNHVKEINCDVEETYQVYLSLCEQKKHLEEIMRTLIVRNVKRKDEYRREIIGAMDPGQTNGIPLTKESYLPFALMEKAIHEILARGDRTFIANVKQSFTSSFHTASKTIIYERDLPALSMLRAMNIKQIRHPKINTVTNEVVANLKNGEKTLIFCDRVETILELQRNISNRLNKSYLADINRLFPDNGLRGFENYCRRFYNKQDSSWLLLQENYIYSVLIPTIKLCNRQKSILPKPSDISEEVSRLYVRYNSTVKANYMYLKRIIEHVVFKYTLAKITNWRSLVKKESEAWFETIQNILNGQYIEMGLNLIQNEEEIESGDASANELRNISLRVIENIMSYQGVWVRYASYLNKINPTERVELVGSMISFLRKDKRFYIELRNNNVKYPDKDDSFCINKTFKRGDLLDWEEAYNRFIDNYLKAPSATREAMLLGLKSSDVVSIITGATKIEARERIKAGFNTPFYPQVLIATPTMQEGVDLQVECKRIIHYDLEWNPASMEQRVGRIDRINSLISKLRDEGGKETLDVFYPYIKNTIDESIYKTLKDREKWFNLLLGGTPQWDTFEMDPNVTHISANIFKNIQLDLGVKW
ncbi:helicase-related protein [Desulfosporosinus sp. FKB]|uniref:helicase-related protein n=1 Tax=Desulfosporosinus sp. FKB TaxID=1969835 RepID=UPI000B49DCB3|nr:helicase-related protein [Desulfosporosinus sp. FKB]